MPHEFRVRWEREGRRAKTVIYQSWNSACTKAQSIRATEAVKSDFPRLADMADLVSCELQVREVGAWRAHDYQPEPSESTLRSMRDHLKWTEPAHVEPVGEDGIPF